MTRGAPASLTTSMHWEPLAGVPLGESTESPCSCQTVRWQRFTRAFCHVIRRPSGKYTISACYEM